MDLDAVEIIDENYDVLFVGSYSRGKKEYVGPSPAVSCRFCEESIPDVSFKLEAHALSELLGNRQLVVTDECDDCNRLFAESLEDHLGKFTKPYRVLGQVKGKKRIPSYKTPAQLSRIDFEPGKGISIAERQDDRFVELVEEENRVKIKFMLERHIPAAVYKALVKMALSLMPLSELGEFRLTKRWIRHRDHTIPFISPLQALVTFVPGPKPFVKTSAMLLRKKSTSTTAELPYCMFVVSFGNLQMQVMVPALSDRKGGDGPAQFLIPRCPTPFNKAWPFGAPKPTVFDLTSGESTEPREFTMTMHYGSKTESR
jgi:hypothetical protein